MMKRILAVIFLASLLCGCASAGPIAIAIPTRKPSVATEEFLGHLYPTNYANRMYHSLADTKYKEALIPLRWAELQGMKIAAQGELEFQETEGTIYEKLAIGVIGAVAGIAGWLTPSPREKAKIVQARHEPPPKYDFDG